MTEDEAQVTQCCGPEGCGYFNDQPRPARWCVGSMCMAWRQSPAVAYRIQGTLGFEAEWRWKPKPGDPCGPGQTVTTVTEIRHGYCGLAGKPD